MVQFIAGIICVWALWRSRRKASSIVICYLLLHIVALGLLNLSGFLTAVISYVFFLPFEDTLVYGCSESLAHPSVVGHRMVLLEDISTVSYVLCGLLTNGMVVSYICHYEPIIHH